MTASPRVTLVMMPWASVRRPGLGVSLLRALAAREGVNAGVVYLNLLLAPLVGADVYEHFAAHPGLFGLSEHLFACAVHGSEALRSDDFLHRWTRGDDAQAALFRRVRDQVIPRYLHDCADRLLADAPAAVGFSCTFNQTLASLALARELRRRDPAVRVLLGGGCVHGDMGLELSRVARDCVDHVFTGEADESWPEFLRALIAGDDPARIPGVASGGRRHAPPRPVHDLDALPIPDFRDYFAQRDALRRGGDPLPDPEGLPFESARGCWWGQKSHCTFCGLNNEGMAFRRKSPARVVRELETLAHAHGELRFLAADNILDHRAFDDLLPALAAAPMHLDLFYEIKANLRRDHVRALAAAGVRWVQPGIESLCTRVLTRMRKGVSALRNVMLLRLCREFGLRVSYNILCGFPGESPADYDAMTRLAPRLRHLDPPSGASTVVQVHRFSPFFSDPARHGLLGVRPAWYYDHLFPAGEADLTRLAYFFERDAEIAPECEPSRAALDAALREWNARPSTLCARLGPGFVAVRRDEAPPRALAWEQSVLLVMLDAVTTPGAVLARATEVCGMEPAEAAGALGALLHHGFAVADEREVVAVVPFERPLAERDLAGWLGRWALPRGAAARPRRSRGCSLPVLHRV